MGADSARQPARPLPPHSLVAAPMVGCSDLPFRLLCRRHGATLCYTEMMLASSFVADPAYRDKFFFSQLASADRPLVTQLAGREADELVAAARIVEPWCDAVDLNLGCPQLRAKEGGYGSYEFSKTDQRGFTISRTSLGENASAHASALVGVNRVHH